MVTPPPGTHTGGGGAGHAGAQLGTAFQLPRSQDNGSTQRSGAFRMAAFPIITIIIIIVIITWTWLGSPDSHRM